MKKDEQGENDVWDAWWMDGTLGIEVTDPLMAGDAFALCNPKSNALTELKGYMEEIFLGKLMEVQIYLLSNLR